jgi:hypothetical protein
MQKIYLYEYCFQESHQHDSGSPCNYAKLLDSADATGNPDLIDFDGKNMIVASELMSGTQELFQVDIENESIQRYKEVYAFAGEEDDKRQWCHEATFYTPPDSFQHNHSTVIVASSSRVKFRKSIMIRFFDYESEKIIAEYPMDWHKSTRGFKAQGIRFIDNQHFIIDATALVVKKYHEELMCKKNQKIPQTKFAQGRLVLFKMNFTVEDILQGKQQPAGPSDFTILGTYDLGVSAVDGISYHDGLAILADQLNDKVLFFRIDVNGPTQPIQFLSEKNGYLMPHGVALSKFQPHMAVTCYGDNSVYIQSVSTK